MRGKVLNTFFRGVMLLALLLLITNVVVLAQEGTPSNEHFQVNTILLEDGTSVDEVIINGPSQPPPGYDVERAPVNFLDPDQLMTVHLLTVPAFDWVFGCSSVSGAMIAGYYDRNGYPNMYTGPTNGGVMPLDNSTTYWPTWSDGHTTYPNLPLAASHNGVDGRTTRGSIDDYWVQYDSSAQDPYITNGWVQHTWGDAIGDYMKTSQSAYSNTDGSTTFYTWTSNAAPLTCADMVTNNIHTRDGTYGRKLFYEARGYSVTDCYNQKTDNTISGGFSLTQFRAEINAGNPVMINLAGHTVVGVGYDDASSTIYIHDTWDYNNHTMTWGGSYSGMALQSVSIVHLTAQTLGAPTLNAISNADGDGNYLVDWTDVSGATSYRLQEDDNSSFTSPDVITTTVSQSSVTNKTPGTYYYRVRAENATQVSGWSNTQSVVVSSLHKVFVPVVLRNYTSVVPAPGDFNKIAPANGLTGQPTNPTLSWGTSSDATSYEYCIDTNNNNACDATWTSTGTNTSIGLSGLSTSTSYYWQVRANNSTSTTYANGSSTSFWVFTTAASPPPGIVNGDFESGSTGWTEYSTHGWEIIVNSFPSGVTPHSGSYAAWLGGDYSDTSYVQQQVTISAGAPYLVYWHWIASEDFCGYDYGYVWINGSTVDQYNLCSSANTGGWVKHSVNLSAYAGQSVTLQIRAVTDSSLNSNLFVDDVSLQASAAAPEPIDGIPNLDAATTQGKIERIEPVENP